MTMMRTFTALCASAFLLAACETSGSQSSSTQGEGIGTGEGSYMGSHSMQEQLVAEAGDRVFFALDSSVVDAEGRMTLQRQAEWLKAHPDVSVTIAGHCDERGTREYNLALGERRANAARDYLLTLGIPAHRLSTVSYGKERPAVLGSDEGAWRQNRRAVTTVR